MMVVSVLGFEAKWEMAGQVWGEGREGVNFSRLKEQHIWETVRQGSKDKNTGHEGRNEIFTVALDVCFMRERVSSKEKND